jgi:mRNA-degrading endonuclease RelE of RelBE toxin-antitoxin system
LDNGLSKKRFIWIVGCPKNNLWKAKPSNRFKSSYKNLSDEMAERVDSALKSLLSEDRPERLGIPKKAKVDGSYKLLNSFRSS